MTGLLYKDILVMRATFIIQAVIMPFYIVLAYFDILNFVFIITYFNTMLMVMPLSAFALDGEHTPVCPLLGEGAHGIGLVAAVYAGT